MTLCLYLVTAFSYIVLMKEKHKDVADNFKINRKGEIGGNIIKLKFKSYFGRRMVVPTGIEPVSPA